MNNWAREFRYDSPRQRYMNVQLDPKDLEGGVIDPISTVWSDYVSEANGSGPIVTGSKRSTIMIMRAPTPW
jgi:hypothetical protein